MNKLNKKGFTLIEMLVVIAIIAVLVSIIIPTVTSATDKAAAATNAANLRSIKAEVVTAMLTNDDDKYTIPATDGTVSLASGVTNNLPTAKKCGKVEAGVAMTIVREGNDIKVTYGPNTIKAFADVAEGTTKPESLAEAKKAG